MQANYNTIAALQTAQFFVKLTKKYLDVLILLNSIKAVSSLEKIFIDSEVSSLTELKHFSMLKNEKKSFQIALNITDSEFINIDIASSLNGFLNISVVKNVPSDLAAPKRTDDFYIKKVPGLYPDLLLPVSEGCSFDSSGTFAFWIEISPNGEKLLPSGNHNIAITTRTKSTSYKTELSVEVIDALLPKQTLIYTNWIHTDCLMTYYGFKAFTDEYWETLRNYLNKAVKYGMNCVLTPIFTPPLDTEIGKERPNVQLVKINTAGNGAYSFDFSLLEKWISISKECGIEYFELSHFFTQWGAKHAPKIEACVNGKEEKIFGWNTKATGFEYKHFLRQFAFALKSFLRKENLEDNVLIHVSDEPPFSCLLSYKKASRIIHHLFPEYKIIDAMSSYPLAKICNVRYPIPANDYIDSFIEKTEELWTYYCSAQSSKNVSNRFFSMPSVRNRILGYQMYKYSVKGFLHWGYNFYFSQYSRKPIDPYKVTDAGKAFASGDSFIVYPGDNFMPLNSLRLNVFYDGLQDMMALQLLESKIGKEAVVKLMEDSTDKPITFSEYPHSNSWLLENREKINQKIKKYI